MFEFFFKYPISVYERGQFALLGAWPAWLLVLFIVIARRGSRLVDSIPPRRGRAQFCGSWRIWVIWGLEALLAAFVLTLLWQPAVTDSQLKPQQNIIAVLVDDSRSMAISENGSTREAQAINALQGGVLDSLNKSVCQTRLYKVSAAPGAYRQPEGMCSRPRDFHA